MVTKHHQIGTCGCVSAKKTSGIGQKMRLFDMRRTRYGEMHRKDMLAFKPGYSLSPRTWADAQYTFNDEWRRETINNAHDSSACGKWVTWTARTLATGLQCRRTLLIRDAAGELHPRKRIGKMFCILPGVLFILPHRGHCRTYVGSGARIGHVRVDQHAHVVAEALIPGFQTRWNHVYERGNSFKLVLELA